MVLFTFDVIFLFLQYYYKLPNHQAENIFHHMGPNLARGWEAASAGTRIRSPDMEVDTRAREILKVSKL